MQLKHTLSQAVSQKKYISIVCTLAQLKAIKPTVNQLYIHIHGRDRMLLAILFLTKVFIITNKLGHFVYICNVILL